MDEQAYHFSPARGRRLQPHEVDYKGKDILYILADDHRVQRGHLSAAASLYLEHLDDVCIARTARGVAEELGKYRLGSPNALLYALLDYQMSTAEKEERENTGSLFLNPSFQHYLGNGGMVFYYTGYPQDVLDNQDIREAVEKCGNVAFSVAQKGNGRLDNILNLFGMGPEAIPGLRRLAEENLDFDLLWNKVQRL